MNLGSGRFSPPIPVGVAPERRAFVAELAFELFRERFAASESNSIEAAVSRVRELIARVSGLEAREVRWPTREERRESFAIAKRLMQFVTRRRATAATVSPTLQGCGIISRASADLLLSRPRFASPHDDSVQVEHLLYEVKAVTRPFRASDVRQLLIYSALMASGTTPPVTVGIVNPRLGTFFECPLDALALDVAGIHADELLHQIVFDISAAEISL